MVGSSDTFAKAQANSPIFQYLKLAQQLPIDWADSRRAEEVFMNYKVLIADDKKYVLNSFRETLVNHVDIEPVFTEKGSEAIDLIRKDPYGFAVVVLDFHFEGELLNGADIAKEMLAVNPKLLILICTGDDSSEAPIASLRAGVKDFIQKGEDLEETVQKIRSYCKKFDETRRIVAAPTNNRAKYLQNEKYIKKIGMIGWSDDLANVAKQIIQIGESNSDNTVLIRGESGTGKELLARAVHNLSPRNNRQFITINCGAIPSNLLESELFGHEKGAFTGADSKKIGKFQIANGGTVFLDEIGDMPLELQVKLLRVLQEGTIEPIGSNQSINVNLRIIAATHVNLEEAIKQGKFREDLYYRLNVIPVNITPLRSRPEDIEPLVIHFQDKHKGKPKKILYKTLRYLKFYNWKGNVRELENTINRLLTMTPDEEITPDHLDAKFFNDEGHEIGNFNCDYPSYRKSLEQFLEQKEKEYLLHKLRGSKSLRSTAKTISIPKSSLQDKLTAWGYTISEVLQ